MQLISGIIRQGVEKYNLISPGDKIAVAVSGGKDSLTLLGGLAKLRSYYKIPFDLIAIIMDVCPFGCETDFSAVSSYCDSLGIPCKIKRTELYNIIFEERKEKNPCSLCARMRRGVLHDMALENCCNKIALGHHKDDAIETFFLNLFSEGRIGCFSPISYLSRKDLYLIRPLVLASEKEVETAALRNNLPIVKSKCPADKASQRSEMKSWILEMERKDPSFKKKIFGAIEKAHIDGF